MENITLTNKDSVRILSINRPECKNALDAKTYDEFHDAMALVRADNEARVLVLTGAGDGFCSGIDLSYAKALTKYTQVEFMTMMKKVQSTFHFENLGIPVIAAVNGYAIGNGCDIVLAADFIYAAKSAVFSMAYTSVGMVPDIGGTYRLTKLVGPSAAKELILTGDRFSAEKALEMGMVNKVAPDESLMDEVMAFAEKLAARPPIALAMAKKSINNSLSCNLAQTLDFEAHCQSQCIKSADALEAMTAMMEKRKPVFRGK